MKNLSKFEQQQHDDRMSRVQQAKKLLRKWAYFVHDSFGICRVIQTGLKEFMTHDLPGIAFVTDDGRLLKSDYLPLHGHIRNVTEKEKIKFKRVLPKTRDRKFSDKVFRRRFRAVQKKHRDEIRYVKQQHKEEKAAIQSALK